MRWDDLFADLEARAEALDVGERAGEIAERTRIEVAALGIGERLQAALGASVRVRVSPGLTLAGTLTRCGSDWLLLDEGAGRESLVATAAVQAIGGLPRAAAPPGSGGAVAARLGIRSSLRAIARDRSAVRLHLRDGSVVDATIDRVGRDFLDLALHPPGEARRRSEVRDGQLVPLAALAVVRRGDLGP